MAKTIKQIAEELGVSKTAVRKKIENLGLSEKVKTDGNRIVIDERQERLIKSTFSQNETKTANQNLVSEKSETLQLLSDMVSTLTRQLEEKDKQLDAKDNQLNAKDRQIEQLNEMLAESQKLIDQQQQLNAIVEQKLSLLEKKEEEPPAEQPKRHWWNFRSKH